MAYKLPTVSTLALALVDLGIVKKPFTTKDLKKGVQGVSDETYGRYSHVYVHAGSPEKRQDLEAKLLNKGIRCNTAYNPTGSSLDVPVSYFRGHNWDE